MIYLWATLLMLVNTAWLGLTLIALPGNWMMVLTTVLVAWWQWEEGMFSPWTLVAVAVLALAGEVLEFVSSAVGVKAAGGTKWGGAGSLVGAVLGAVPGTVLIPIPVLGSLVGVCGGAAVGAWVFEILGGKTTQDAARYGLGAGTGRFVGALMKFALGLLIWLIITVAAFWP